jgi:BRCT domain type II-containing protein
MALDMPKEVEDVEKAEKNKEETDLKEEAKAASTGQMVDRLKLTSQPVPQKVAIRDPDFTKQKSSVIFVKE